jgi:hypothetical protein
MRSRSKKTRRNKEGCWGSRMADRGRKRHWRIERKRIKRRKKQKKWRRTEKREEVINRRRSEREREGREKDDEKER